MNAEVINLVKDATNGLNLCDYERAFSKLETKVDYNKVTNKNIYKLAFITTHFNDNPEVANKLLINLIPSSNIEELIIIFSKVTDNSTEFLNICKEYASQKSLRNSITKIFKKNGISYEEGRIFNFEFLSGEKRKEVVQKLLQNLNTADFKRTKLAVKQTIRSYPFLMPNLNNIGYKNLKEIKCLDLISQEYSPVHFSDIVRIEYLKTIYNFEDLFSFLYVNQIIDDPNNRAEMAAIYIDKIKSLRNNEILFAYTDILYHGILKSMIKSSNTNRRHLGAILYLSLIDLIKDVDHSKNIEILIFDINGEIRNTSLKYKDKVVFNQSKLYSILLEHDCLAISAASKLLSDNFISAAIDDLNKLYNNSSENIHGLMHYLNTFSYYSDEYKGLVESIYHSYKDLDTKYTWRILKECCNFYKNCNDQIMLMKILLDTDHLGIVCHLRDLIDLTDSEGIDILVEEGIKQLYAKDKNSRKSGGLSQYFLKIIYNQELYCSVKHKLFGIICTTQEGLYKVREDMSDHILFHVLNIFTAFSNSVDDGMFYMLLGLSCLEHSSFIVKNCGFALLSSVYKKALIADNTFDSFFNIYRDLRSKLLIILESSIIKKDHQAIYSLLFIYQRITNLSDKEKDLIKKSIKVDSLLRLKVNHIISKERANNMENTRQLDYFIDLDSLDAYQLSKVLIYLNGEDSNIMKYLRLDRFSLEYAIHQICNIISRKKLASLVLNYIDSYCLSLSNNESEDVYNPSLDFSYFKEILSCSSE